MSFSALGLSDCLLHAVAAGGYVEPTAVQGAVIPVILRGGDVWARAATGSGKTAAYVWPILQGMEEGERPRGRFVRALVLVPTRELAVQVGEVFREDARHLRRAVKTMAVFGGVSINPQMIALGGGVDVLVATPGRLLDLLDHRAISLSKLATLVLDEADRLLEEGFREEVERVLALVPTRRQSLLFSATFPASVEALASDVLCDPLRWDDGSEVRSVAAPDILQRVIEVDVGRRTQLLRHLIETHGWSSVLVFVATKYATEHVARKLRQAGLVATAIHGDLSQGARREALEDFQAGRVQVLLATDLAARGIDIPRLPVVVNFDLPRSAVDYTHRIGRTGRAGESGLAISFVSASTHAHCRLIEKRHGVRLPREEVEGFEPVETEVPVPPAGGVKGKRKSKKDKLREARARALANE